ncbi:DUF3025 domain-containing protein [Aestuariibacter halophilus]|uniref:DUF3025 domain-containing protein n=1 Tax=Fluctibacter halophilus TaxID=226011 RepID=A0ABS8G8P6_9ALTE|nr:DUF3025 domain-containing protein [Aestuariibacter halophilus]MCC2616834.1 DUF3025 domain-containing protein [Aestuariibacter halophilus]
MTSSSPMSLNPDHPSHWNALFHARADVSPFNQLNDLLSISHLPDWPDADGLNRWVEALGVATVPAFVDQDSLAQGLGYYEEIIASEGIIPTRSRNWHDLFNGIIWLLFPRTKALLNRLHMDDIAAHGVHPRTRRRNHITHFDECGVVLAVSDPSVPELMAEHQWRDALANKREAWGNTISPFVFGHANLEMLLTPHLSLTGKWLAVAVENDFHQLPFAEQCHQLDALLASQLQQQQTFSQPRPLRPLPLLGIPGFWPDNQNPAFYDNTAVFRPKPTPPQTPPSGPR